MKVPIIKKTKDYGKFDFIKWNRSLSNSNLNRLETENKKNFQMHLFPIVVDKNFQIVDGQHRFQVCKTNKWDVYYVQDNESLEGVQDYYEKIRSVNAVGRRHTMLEKFDMLLKAGNKKAKYVNNTYLFFEKEFALNTVVSTLSTGGNGGGVLKNLDSGDLRLISKKYGIDFLTEIYNSNIESRERHMFVIALQLIYKQNDIKLKELIRKLEDYGFEAVPKMSKEMVREKIIRIWNKGRKRNNRIAI